jgi:hypothetical protein
MSGDTILVWARFVLTTVGVIHIAETVILPPTK